MRAARVLRPGCLAYQPPTLRIPPLSSSPAAILRYPRSLPPIIRPTQTTPLLQRRHYQTEDEIREKLRHARPLLSDRAAQRITTAGRSRGSRGFVLVCVAAAVAFYFANSQTVPVTGRRRFNFLSDWVLDAVGAGGSEVAREILEEGGRFIPENDWRYREVRQVVSRLAPVSGLADNWKIYVIDDESNVNAMVTPGAHLFVFSGMFRVCRNTDALAAVLGHEIAHNVASHSAERLSAAVVGNLTSGTLFFLAGALPGLGLYAIWTMTGGRYLQDLLFNLPMGRKMESEADYIGLMMMAEACFDPREAVAFWQRMSQMQSAGGFEVPEILSTHPSNSHRIEKLREWLPEAMAKRKESDCSGTGVWAEQFRNALLRRQLVHI